MKKKNLILLTLLFAYFSSYSQHGRKFVKGPITIFDTLKVDKGDIIQLGQGSNADKNFIYVHDFEMTTAPNSYANKKFEILQLKETEDKLNGKEYYAIFIGELFRYKVDLANAIKYGEVIGINNIKFNQPNTPGVKVIQPKQSVADELLKLKKLYDAGVLTKEEYEAQKKKLLESN
jgi:hypothetical protein